MCRLVGQLAIFNKNSRRAPDLPRYDHDDLGTCFYRVKQHLEALDLTKATYEEEPFIGEGRRMQVKMQAKWLEPIWQMFVGVQSPLKQEDVVKLFTMRGKLDMKIGSADRVDVIFERGMRGLIFSHAHRPPRVLPADPNLTYFQVERTSQKEEWDQVQKTLTLAIRFNKNLFNNKDVDIQGQRTIPITLGQNAQTTMQFSLFLVPQEK
jgi:type VI secretion system protein ImpJ